MCLEKQDTKSEPPEINHANYEWEENEATKSLISVMLPKMSNFSFRPWQRRVVKSQSTARAEDRRGGKHRGLIRGLPIKCLNYGRLHGRFSCIFDAFGARI